MKLTSLVSLLTPLLFSVLFSTSTASVFQPGEEWTHIELYSRKKFKDASVFCLVGRYSRKGQEKGCTELHDAES
ncbi:Protein of unknown function [Pyronema omphalodes CBS 100304]|uniref:Secreted protein n=1 Tax=Pyronema omphalodes (strain CBS 100304) TaxID=1076935 RepID=U4LH61_PYROM|nr:Protein of unknown function [Pyronema omphalodes CBS 100304]